MSDGRPAFVTPNMIIHRGLVRVGVMLTAPGKHGIDWEYSMVFEPSRWETPPAVQSPPRHCGMVRPSSGVDTLWGGFPAQLHALGVESPLANTPE